MSAKSRLKVFSALGWSLALLCVQSAGVMAQLTSEETEALRQDLAPSEPQNFGTGDASQLQQLNPGPILLDVPTDPAEVTIDITQPITLEEAMILARRNNRELQIAELDIGAAQARLDEAKSDKLPDVALTGNFTRTQTLVDEDDVIEPGFNQVDAAATAQFDVLTNGQRPASIQAAREDLEASNLEYKIELWQLRLDVTNDYFDLQQADALIGIAESAVSNAKDNLQNTQILEEQGVGTRFDVLRSEVQLADLEQQLVQARAQKEIAQRQLAQRLSLADNATVTAKDPIREVGKWPLSLADSISRAQRFRAELAEVLSEREIALLNEKIAKGSLGPFLTVSGSLTAAGNFLDSVPTFPDGTSPDLTGGDIGYSVGAQADFTIFDGGRARALARQQAISAQIADTQFKNTKNVIRFQIEQNYNSLTSSLENISTNRKAVEQAEQSLFLAKLRLSEGLGTQLEVSNEETSLTRAQSNLLQAIIDYNRALVGLQRFVADPNLEIGVLESASAWYYGSRLKDS